MSDLKISFPHTAPLKGGPGSFQSRFVTGLIEHGWKIGYSEEKNSSDIVVVIGGTRKLSWLRHHRKEGIPVIYRLDGINWLHRKKKVSPQKWLVNEARNLLCQYIRSKLATHIIYQSHFVEKWWKEVGWYTDASSTVIYNGVDLQEFRPHKRDESLSLLCVEGNLDYSPYAIELLNILQEELTGSGGFRSIIAYGGFQNPANRKKLHPSIEYKGTVLRSEIASVYRNAIYLSLDIHAACPNTVIESMASGIPVIGFDTGALKELIGDSAGEVANYGSDSWELGKPDASALMEIAEIVKKNWDTYSENARSRAVMCYDINSIVGQYMDVIEQSLKND